LYFKNQYVILRFDTYVCFCIRTPFVFTVLQRLLLDQILEFHEDKHSLFTGIQENLSPNPTFRKN
jgi:hypothetical protein